MAASNLPSPGKLLLLPVLAAIVMVSGCTDGNTIAGGPGVFVLNWEPDFYSVYSGDEVKLRFRVQNQGGEQAQDVIATLHGITPEEWQATSLYGFRMNSFDVPVGNLNPQSPSYNTPGETFEDFFTLRAPQLPEGISQTYNPRIRVAYTYRTTATKPITLVNEDELRRLADSGMSLPTGLTSSSAGPLSVDITTGSAIKISEGRRTFPISIRIYNMGGGVVSPREGAIWSGYGTPSSDDYMVRMVIELPPGLGFVTCSEFQGNIGDEFFGFGGGAEVMLWEGRDKTVNCELNVVTPPFASEQRTIKVALLYDYYVDAGTTITVQGTSQQGNLF
jgi:hypothetical protein